MLHAPTAERHAGYLVDGPTGLILKSACVFRPVPGDCNGISKPSTYISTQNIGNFDGKTDSGYTRWLLAEVASQTQAI